MPCLQNEQWGANQQHRLRFVCLLVCRVSSRTEKKKFTCGEAGVTTIRDLADKTAPKWSSLKNSPVSGFNQSVIDQLRDDMIALVRNLTRASEFYHAFENPSAGNERHVAAKEKLLRECNHVADGHQ